MLEWKTIKDFEDYEISNYGDVKSHKYKKETIYSRWLCTICFIEKWKRLY